MSPKRKTEENKPVRSLWDEAPKERFIFSENTDEEPDGSGKTFFLVVLAVALLAGGGYYLFKQASQPNVGVEFSKPSRVFLGEPFEVVVSFSNFSDKVLKSAKLSIALPDGIALVGVAQSQRIREQALGDLGPGSVNQEKMSLIATDGSQTLKRLEATLTYAVSEESRAQFEAKGDVDIPIGEPAVSLNFMTPQNVVSGQNFDVVVTYKNNTARELKNVTVKLDYPPVFRFDKSTIEPSSGNSIWDLGALTPNSEGKFAVTGSVVGPEQTVFSLSGNVAVAIMGQAYIITTQTASVGIAIAPISLGITINGTVDFVAHTGDTVRYVLAYKNNSEQTLENATIQAKFVGELFDFSSVSTAGSFDPVSRTVSWSSSNAPALRALPPGAAGTVDVDIKIVNDFPIRRLSDKNYFLSVQARVESPTKPSEGVARALSVASLETKVAGAVRIDTAGYFRDAASGILNNGPYPPKVGQPTQYSIHWRIKNFTTDISNVRVTAALGPGVRFTGVTKSSGETKPSLSTSTGQIVWEIPFVPATKGVVGSPLEGIFQVELTPDAGSAGSDATLVGTTAIYAQDNFTGTPLSSSDEPMTTAVPDDATIEGDRHVQP